MSGSTGRLCTTVRFVDTNVLLYTVSTAATERSKTATARDILAGPDVGLSTQVLGEFYVQATRATRHDALSHDQAERLVRSFSRFAVQDVTLGIVLAAMATRDRHDISYWDAAIIEAARSLGAREVLSEDLQQGMDFAGVVVHNPFE